MTLLHALISVLLLLPLLTIVATAQPIEGWALAGNFTMIGSDLRSPVTWWKGKYATIGGGVPAPVQVIAEHQDSLYLGGSFNQFLPKGTKHKLSGVARWDGKNWNNMHGGLDGCTVKAFAFYEEFIFVALDGSCKNGNLTISGIGMYSHAMGWNNMGGGVTSNDSNSYVSSVLVFGDLLVVGGFFSSAGGRPANLIAWWNITAAAWSDLSFGADQLGIIIDEKCNATAAPPCSQVAALGEYESRVVIGGTFMIPASMQQANVSSKNNYTLLMWSPSSSYALFPTLPPLAAAPTCIASVMNGSLFVAAGRDVLVYSAVDDWISLLSLSTTYPWPWLLISQLIIDQNTTTLYAFGELPGFVVALLSFIPDQIENVYTNASRWAPELIPSVQQVYAVAPITRDFVRMPFEVKISVVYLTGLACAVGGFLLGGMLFFAGRYTATRNSLKYEQIP